MIDLFGGKITQDYDMAIRAFKTTFTLAHLQSTLLDPTAWTIFQSALDSKLTTSSVTSLFAFGTAPDGFFDDCQRMFRFFKDMISEFTSSQLKSLLQFMTGHPLLPMRRSVKMMVLSSLFYFSNLSGEFPRE